MLTEIPPEQYAAALDACADEEHQACVPLSELEAVHKLAAARAQETGAGGDVPEDWRLRVVAALMTLGAQPLPKQLQAKLPWLVDEVFPSPFTDPLLPIGERQPSRTEVEREYLALRDKPGAELVIEWPSRSAVLVHDEKGLEDWLEGSQASVNGTSAMLIGVQQVAPGPLTTLLQAA
ncbi:MAG: hypothetical protein IH898_08895, partial [Planctomycetes bacterium]|nr:hypothetical protein [Planctomycetota bacterium]